MFTLITISAQRSAVLNGPSAKPLPWFSLGPIRSACRQLLKWSAEYYFCLLSLLSNLFSFRQQDKRRCASRPVCRGAHTLLCDCASLPTVFNSQSQLHLEPGRFRENETALAQDQWCGRNSRSVLTNQLRMKKQSANFINDILPWLLF